MIASRPRLIRQREYAERVGVSFDAVTKQVQRGRCDVQPCAVRPYRWREDDVERWIRTTSLVDARRTHARRRHRLRALEPAS